MGRNAASEPRRAVPAGPAADRPRLLASSGHRARAVGTAPEVAGGSVTSATAESEVSAAYAPQAYPGRLRGRDREGARNMRDDFRRPPPQPSPAREGGSRASSSLALISSRRNAL